MRNVILSPHYDDAVFSCYGLIKNDNSLVINIFTGHPKKAQYKLWDLICGEINSTKMMVRRKAENESVFNELGINFLDLGFQENQYQKNRNILEIEQAIRRNLNAGDIVYAPVAKSRIFRHPDHVLINSVAKNLSKDFKVKYYLDVPYMNPRAKHTDEETLRLNKSETTNKLNLAKKYKTQFRATNLISLGNLKRSINSGLEKYFK